MGAPFRSSAIEAHTPRARQMMARNRVAAAERRIGELVAKLHAGHTRLSADGPALFEIRDALKQRRDALEALDSLYFEQLGAADIWEAEQRPGGPTPLDEDDLADAIFKRLELNYAAAIEADERPGELTFHDDARATYRAGAGY